MVKRITSTDEVITYLEAVATGHSTYGELGDVVVFYKSGMTKPIIHRAICDLIYNSTGGGFDLPVLADLPPNMWSVSEGEKRWWNMKGLLELYDIGYMGITLIIDLGAMLDHMSSENYEGAPHGGLITMGDYNWYRGLNGTLLGKYDQKWIGTVKEPLIAEWLVGKARGELPWFGLLKLYATGSAPSYTPKNSQLNLVASIGAIIIIPIVLDIVVDVFKGRRPQLSREEKEKSDEPKEGGPPGVIK